MILAAWPSYDFWHERWNIEVLTQLPGESPRWRRSPPVQRDGHLFSDMFRNLAEAQDRCDVLNQVAAEEIEREVNPSRRISLKLKAEKALQARKRLSEEEQLMLIQARARRSKSEATDSNLSLHKDSEEYRDAIAEQLQSFPYLQMVLIREDGRPRMFLKMKDGIWSSPRYPNRKGVLACHRSKIANGFGLSGLSHWGKTKAEIRKILLPRANELLQQAGIKRLLAEALAQGKRVLVYGSYVFWYETHKTPGWIVKERSSGKDGTDGEALWREGKIVSKNHGRIVVLPYTKEDGTNVLGHTKNAPNDGPALPRHPDDIVEIPFEELDGDLMIGLLGELPYE